MENSTFYNNTFYNRVKETKQIVDCINSSDQDTNKIILLGGKTGVGKSGLVRKILRYDLKDQSSIVVTISKVSPDTIENLHYINVIYRRMSELAKEHFFDAMPSPFQQGLLNLKNLIRFGFGVVWSKYVGHENQLCEPTEESSVIRKKNYIIDLLKRRHYLLDIENIQNIDTQSLEILQDIVLQLSGTTLILEYTIDENHTPSQFSSLYNELKSRISKANVSAFFISMLEFEEAKKLAPPGVPESRLEAIYRQGEGNLVNVILYEAEKTAYISDCYLLNNLAVLDLLSRRYTNQTAKNLWDALLVCNDTYEKIIIMCNLAHNLCIISFTIFRIRRIIMYYPGFMVEPGMPHLGIPGLLLISVYFISGMLLSKNIALLFTCNMSIDLRCHN